MTTLTYDAARNLTRAGNDAGHAVTLEYDATNRLVSRGNLLTLRDANNNLTRREYDDEGNLVKQIVTTQVASGSLPKTTG